MTHYSNSQWLLEFLGCKSNMFPMFLQTPQVQDIWFKLNSFKVYCCGAPVANFPYDWASHQKIGGRQPAFATCLECSMMMEYALEGRAV